MNKDIEDDESDRDYAQDGQEPVETVQEVSGETQKDNKEKKVDRSPIAPLCTVTLHIYCTAASWHCRIIALHHSSTAASSTVTLQYSSTEAQ